ncbi:MATE family efflux transporter [Marivita hallyeonensis]|uniref:Putative efflux protein, MATE family n=1 Tax=Marivita hallyeonensis TaxID=996342 RepID=A0A1M5MMW3_9RHOB|nr:MATE family efflux transporter [Marivita hallyeonensis]SHG78730.1 putative efflux protein, MATE family [Marivita hallyeonensis]
MAERDLTKGPIWRALAAVSAPMSLGIFGVLSVGLADAYFLGQLGEAPLAAVGYIYPVTTAITSLAIGLSAGANATVSQALGRGSPDHNRLSLHAIGLGLSLAILVAIGFYFFAGDLFSLMGAGPDALTEAKSYVPLWALSFPCLVTMMVVNAVFRAHGDGATSAAIMVLAAVVNIALNPLFIFGWGPIPQLGTEGAALATFIGRLAAVVVAVWYAFYSGALCWPDKLLPDLWASTKQILNVGVPAAFSNAINPAGMALVTAAVATIGDAAVAGFGAATRVQSMVLVALFALSAGIGPVVGQNWGADQPDRARRGLAVSWLFCVGYGVAIAVVLFFFADPIAALLADDGQAAQYAAQYLQIVGFSLFGYGVLVTTNAAMNARSKALYSTGLSLARIFICYVPLAWVGVMLFGYIGILVAAVVANVFAVAGAYWCAAKTGLLPDSWPAPPALSLNSVEKAKNAIS